MISNVQWHHLLTKQKKQQSQIDIYVYNLRIIIHPLFYLSRRIRIMFLQGNFSRKGNFFHPKIQSAYKIYLSMVKKIQKNIFPNHIIKKILPSPAPKAECFAECLEDFFLFIDQTAGY